MTQPNAKNIDELLNELQAVCDNATPGPWLINEPEYGWPVANTGNSSEDGKDYEVNGCGSVVRDGFGNTDAKQDAAFIAASREAVPRLIRALRHSVIQRNRLATLLEDETRDTCGYRIDTDADDDEITAILQGNGGG